MSRPAAHPRRFSLVAVLVAGALLVGAAAAAAAGPSWLWTSAHAATAIKAKAPLLFADLKPFSVQGASCTGVSKATAGHFDAFACTVTLVPQGKSATTRKAWLKVRHAGAGVACVSRTSLAGVPSSCLAVASTGGSQASKGSPEAAATALRYSMQRRMDASKGGMWQDFTRLDCSGSAGLYQCSFGESVSGTATVFFTNSGPVLYYTTLQCTDSEAAAYPVGCKFP